LWEKAWSVTGQTLVGEKRGGRASHSRFHGVPSEGHEGSRCRETAIEKKVELTLIVASDPEENVPMFLRGEPLGAPGSWPGKGNDQFHTF